MRLSNCFSDCAAKLSEEDIESYLDPDYWDRVEAGDTDMYDDDDWQSWAYTTAIRKDDYGLPYDE